MKQALILKPIEPYAARTPLWKIPRLPCDDEASMSAIDKVVANSSACLMQWRASSRDFPDDVHGRHCHAARKLSTTRVLPTDITNSMFEERCDANRIFAAVNMVYAVVVRFSGITATIKRLTRVVLHSLQK